MKSVRITIMACFSLLLLIGCHKEQSGIALGVYKLPWEGDYIITPYWGGGVYFGIVVDSSDRHELFCTGAYHEYGLEEYDCWLEIPETVIANVRYLNNGYRTVTYTVTGISDYSFDGSNLTSITITNSIREIGNHAFERCTSLTNITLPEGLQSIGFDTFRGCSSLATCTCYALNPPLSYHDSFEGCPLQAIYVPRESVEAYKTAEGWQNYASIIYSIE